MKLLYTDIYQDMTTILAKEAQRFAQEGKRVFYIAPNSLSFEKEKKVLETLPQGASVAIMVTRFTQLARYFLLNDAVTTPQIDDTGLSMMVFKALSQLEPEALKVYGRLRQDSAFIKQLVQLYKELKTANMTAADLSALTDDLKQSDLQVIFQAVDRLLVRENFDLDSPLSRFRKAVSSGVLDEVLCQVVLVVDGFTRFSAEEELLVASLAERCHEVVIGTYISSKAYTKQLIQGNLYEASLTFFRHLAVTYKTKPTYITLEGSVGTSFSRLSSLLEATCDYSVSTATLSDSDQQAIAIWDVLTVQEELRQVATSIRQLLETGVRYKDIVVLLSDVDTYQLQLKQVFERFDIPYYISKTESMAHHPLVTVVESLERIKRYRYRLEDVQQLLRSGLYGNISEEVLDHFEHYLYAIDCQGSKAFSNPFTLNPQDRYDLEALNATRAALVDPLTSFFKQGAQTGQRHLEAFTRLLTQAHLSEQLAQLSATADPVRLDQHQQVWETFCHLLQQMASIFGDVILSVEEFLALLRSGMLAADYRTVPATVDVVNVRSYDLVEPHSAPYVFALGMTQSHFPSKVQQTSLLSDDERLILNEATADSSHLSISRDDQGRKNRFVLLSLLNAATKRLVITAPRLVGEGTEQLSPYLKELIALGVKREDYGLKRLSASSEAIGHYRDLLATVIAINQGALSRELNAQEQTFWAVAVRYLRRRLAENQVLIPHVLEELVSRPVSQEAMRLTFPQTEPMSLSASALTTFYNNQYLYFLRYVLRLEEWQSRQPDARYHGTYLHRILERLLAQPHADVASALETIISDTNQEAVFSFIYGADEEGRFSQQVLADIARTSASLLQQRGQVDTIGQEAYFALSLTETLKVTGMIDRIDRLETGGVGVVDYKSSKHHFDLQRFYNGLAPQLVTYLEAIKAKYHLQTADLFGAMYLQLQEPQLALSKLSDLEQLPQKAQAEMTYKGIFQENGKAHLATGAYQLKEAVYSTEEIEALLAFNRHLFERAEQTIRSGLFSINPYTEDGKSVQGEQLKAITHFEADRHLLTHSRQLLKLPRIGKKERLLQLIAEAVTDE